MNIKNNFAEKLKLLREENNLSQLQLAKKLEVSRVSISYYENSERTADIEFLYKVSQVFNVTSDYLLGLSNIPYTDSRHDEYCRRLIAENAMLERKLSDIKNILK